MARPYFTNLPIMNYDGYVSIDLLSRVTTRKTLPIAEAYYFNYVVKEGERADTIASDFYGNPNYLWIIYLINDITDPLHEWTKTEEDLYSFIVKKYGSYENAANQIVFYRNNYDTDQTELTAEEYNILPVNPSAAEPYNLKRFYSPVVNEYNNVILYRRAQIDEVFSTNMIVSITVDPTDYEVGERVKQTTGGVINATAFVCGKDTDKILVQHVTGTFNTTNPIIGEKSGASEIATDVVTVKNVIPSLETQFFTEVTALDYETELNESRKIIKLVRPELVDGLESQLRGLFER